MLRNLLAIIVLAISILTLVDFAQAGSYILAKNTTAQASRQIKDSNQVFEPLKNWLTAQGVNEAEIISLLNNQQVKFEGKLMSDMLSYKERTRDYQGFFAPDKIRRAYVFKASHANILKQVENNTSVPAGVIVAILLIESELGSYTGKTLAFNTLASQAVLDTAAARQILARTWPASQKDYLKSQAALERFARRSDWARNELLALLRLSQEWNISLLSIKGSAAGALGWCQFMPTSIEKWGFDASGDGRVDVNNPFDAIASIGYYLREHGWKAGLSREEQLQVVLTYNKSTPYAEAVLLLAEKI